VKKIAIVGLGSIGQRHYKNLSEAESQLKNTIAVVSRRKNEIHIESEIFDDVETCLDVFRPDIIFICNETYLHKATLDQLLKVQFQGQIVIEKPIFDLSPIVYEIYNHLNIVVSYNLRFNPLLELLKKELSNSEKVLSSHVYVGQYLPTWRPKADYRQSYSARAAKGGGVLLDLSHELDFSQWLFGRALGVFSLNGKYSDLDIDSMDTCGLLLKYENCPVMTMQMNYLDRKIQRFIIVNTNQNTYKVDLISKQFFKNEILIELPLQNEDSYQHMIQNILYDNSCLLTTYGEAIAIMKTISAAMESNTKKIWCEL
jgi:predicted dehydrogenase